MNQSQIVNAETGETIKGVVRAVLDAGIDNTTLTITLTSFEADIESDEPIFVTAAER